MTDIVSSFCALVALGLPVLFGFAQGNRVDLDRDAAASGKLPACHFEGQRRLASIETNFDDAERRAHDLAIQREQRLTRLEAGQAHIMQKQDELQWWTRGIAGAIAVELLRRLISLVVPKQPQSHPTRKIVHRRELLDTAESESDDSAS